MGDAGIGLRSDFVCRVSGLPASAFAALRLTAARSLLDEIGALDRELESRRQPLVDRLHAAVGGETDGERRRRLLRLKRDVFNLRGFKVGTREGLVIAPELDAELDAFESLLARRSCCEAGVCETCAEETAQVRRRFKALLQDPDFQKGLLLSSRSLFSQLPAYFACDDRHANAREEHVERGLLRYASRAAMKATPFGTFCAVIPGRFAAPNGGPTVRLNGNPRVKRSHVRLNKALYALLMGHLKQRPAVRQGMPVELNPTVEQQGARFRFLIAGGGHEVFQRMERHVVLDLITGILTREAGGTVADLVESLAGHPQLEASREEIVEYIDRLLQVGFLRFRPGIREQDADWDLPLRALLARIEDDHATQVAGILAELRALASAFAVAPVGQRTELLKQGGDRLAAAFEAMAIRGSLGRKPLLYEDATADASCVLELDPATAAAVRDLLEFVRVTAPAAWPRGEQANMRRFFDDYYGATGDGIPLLRFYEDYYREHFKGHLERQRRAGGWPAHEEEGEEPPESYDLANPFGLALVSRIQASQTRVRELVGHRIRAEPGATEISISPTALAAALDLPPRPARCRSLSLFAQVVAGPDGPRLLLPGGRQLAGYGKYFSRFLYMLPEGLSARVRSDNRALTRAYLAEIGGDAAFNANLHPPLLDWEISYPTGEAGTQDTQLTCADLDVRRDPDDPDTLELVHRPTGTTVIPVDLGFLNPRLRPPLYQLLSHFGPPVTYGLPQPGLAGPEENPAVGYRPRIVFGEHLVLTRRTWVVPGALFPRPGAGDSAGPILLMLDRWRRAHGIPERVYARILPGPPPKPAASSKPAHQGEETPGPPEDRAPPAPRTFPSRDFVKPQFIDFANPLLVGLFARLPATLPRFTAVLEECLPDEAEQARSDGASWATEFILQIDEAEPRPAFDLDLAPPGERYALVE